MIICQADVGGGTKGQKYPQLTKQMLLEYVKSEYAVLLLFIEAGDLHEVQQELW